MICINPNTKEFKDILAQVGDPLAAEIEYIKKYGDAINKQDALPKSSKVVALEEEIKTLPIEIFNSIEIVEDVPDSILGNKDFFFAMKDVFYENGITDPLLINWAGINKDYIGHPRNIKSTEELESIVKKVYNKKIKEDKYLEFKTNPLALKSFKEWKEALKDYPLVFQDIMLTHAIKHITNPQRRSKYVLQLSKVALTNTYGILVNKPHEANRLGKLYDQEVLATVSDAVDHEPSASGKGYWVHVPRTEKPKSRLDYEHFDRFELNNDSYSKIDAYRKNGEIISKEEYAKATELKREEIKSQENISNDYKKNIELLRKLSPSTWCTATSMTEYYVANYDNYLLIVNGATVAGIEAEPNKVSITSAKFERNEDGSTYILSFENDEKLYEYANKTGEQYTILRRASDKIKVKEVTSIANNGMAPIDHLEDIIAFFEKHNLDLNNASVNKAIKARDKGKTDKDVFAEEFEDYYPGIHEFDLEWQERIAIDRFNGEYENEPDWEAMERYDREMQEYNNEYQAGEQFVSTIDNIDDARRNIDVVKIHYNILNPALRAFEDIANAAIEGDAHNIAHVDPTLPFYDELAVKAVTKNPYVFTYLSEEKKNLPSLREIYNQYEKEKQELDDQLPFSKTNSNLIQGYYDSKNDKVVVVASNTPVNEGSKVAIHEVAHRGMLRMAKELGGVNELGEALFAAENELMKKLPELLERTGHKSLNSLMLDYGFTKESKEGKIKLLMELAARWAETLVNKPKPSWWKQLITKISNWITKFTGKVLNEEEVNELIGGFVKYGTSAVKPGVQELFDSNPELANQVYEALGFEIKSYDKPWRDGTNTNKAKSFALKNKPSEIFELVEDKEKGNYSAHFKTSQKNSLSDEEKQKLIEVVAANIPVGGKLSTWGTVTKGGFSALERFLRAGFIKTSETRDSNGIIIPVYVKQNKSNLEQQALQQYSQYLDTIFPDSKVKNIVYRGSEKGIEKDERFWLYFSDSPHDAYLYGKAHISKGGNITERNPIDAINIAAQKYFKNKYNNNNLLNSLKEEKIKGVIEKSSKITRKLKDIPIKELESRSEFTPLDLDEEDPSKEIIRNYLKTGNNSNYEITTNKYDKSEFNNVSEIAKKYNVEERDVELVFSIQEVENRYRYVKIESEADLMKPYDDTWYQENIEDYTKARKYIDDVLGIDNVRENIGKLESVILNITNPLDGGNQEDLLNNREAYRNGHDGAILSGGEHFIIKNKPEQIHILGNKQDIEGFKNFVENRSFNQVELDPELSNYLAEQISQAFNVPIPTMEKDTLITADEIDAFNRDVENRDGALPKEYFTGVDDVNKWSLNQSNLYDLVDKDTGEIYLRDVNLSTGMMEKKETTPEPVPEKEKQEAIDYINNSVKEFRLDEILAERGYDVNDIISNLASAENKEEFNKIINKLLRLLC